MWTHQHASVYACMCECTHTYMHTQKQAHTETYNTLNVLKPITELHRVARQLHGDLHVPSGMVRLSVEGTPFMMPSRSWDQSFPFSSYNPPWTSIEGENWLRIPSIPSQSELTHSLHKYFLRAHCTPAPGISTYDAEVEK